MLGGASLQTRTCAQCGTEKSVAEIWYLVDEENTSFVCGLCYRDAPDETPRRGPTGSKA